MTVVCFLSESDITRYGSFQKAGVEVGVPLDRLVFVKTTRHLSPTCRGALGAVHRFADSRPTEVRGGAGNRTRRGRGRSGSVPRGERTSGGSRTHPGTLDSRKVAATQLKSGTGMSNSGPR